MFSRKKLIKRMKSSTKREPHEKFVRLLGDNLTEEEQELFDCVELGDIAALDDLLKENKELNEPKKNNIGYTLMQVAVLNQNYEIIKKLIENGYEYKTGLDLAAKREDWNTKAYIEKIIQIALKPRRLGSRTSEQHSPLSQSSFNDTNEIFIDVPDHPGHKREVLIKTPNWEQKDKIEMLILAATHENVPEIQRLLQEGVSLPDPEDVKYKNDPVKEAEERIKLFKALTSPSYMLLTKKDPIEAALENGETLEKYALIYPENKEELQAISEKCSDFLLKLLSLCENENEVTEMLSQDSGLKRSYFRLHRLQLAVGLKQKKFVTNPSCQHILRKIWFPDSMMKWAKLHPFWKFCYIMGQILLSPLHCLCIIIFGCNKEIFRKGNQNENSNTIDNTDIPYNKFIYAATFYFLFLIFLLLNVLEERDHYGFQYLNWLITIWVVGHVAKIGRDIYDEGFYNYATSWWTAYELIMVLLFVVAISCSLVSHFQDTINIPSVACVSLSLISDGLRSIAVTMAYMRVLQWFHLSQNFGHLIISFSKMVDILIQYAVVFGIILIAYSIGVYTVYKDYQLLDGEESNGRLSFLEFKTTLTALFWALFGHGDANYAMVPKANLRYNIQVRNLNTSHEFINNHNISIMIGYSLWAGYHVVFIIIIMNMVIALMTKTMESICEKSDMEWKFARTKVWLYYFDPYNAVPPPLNLLWLFRCLLVFFVNTCRKPGIQVDVQSNKTYTTTEEPCKKERIDLHESRKTIKGSYQTIINKVTERYFHKKKLISN